jgi:hypothetical protein
MSWSYRVMSLQSLLVLPLGDRFTDAAIESALRQPTSDPIDGHRFAPRIALFAATLLSVADGHEP